MIEDALYVPDMKTLTLVSPCQLFRSQGIKTYFNDENCLVLPDGSSINFSESNRSYILKIEPLDTVMMNYGRDDVTKFMSVEGIELCFKLSSDTVVTSELIHHRCCHFSPDRINASLPFVTGLCQVPRYFCHDCLRGGMKAPSVLPPRKKTDVNRVTKPTSRRNLAISSGPTRALYPCRNRTATSGGSLSWTTRRGASTCTSCATTPLRSSRSACNPSSPTTLRVPPQGRRQAPRQVPRD